MADEKNNRNFQEMIDYLWKKRVAVVAGALMLLGIITAFFYVHIGGILIGLAVGIGFYDEILNYFIRLRDTYSALGLFKMLMTLAVILYLLRSLPTFIIFIAVGWAALFFIRRLARK